MLDSLFSPVDHDYLCSHFSHIDYDDISTKSHGLSLSTLNGQYFNKIRQKLGLLAEIGANSNYDLGYLNENLTASIRTKISKICGSLHIHIGSESLTTILNKDELTCLISNRMECHEQHKLISIGHQRHLQPYENGQTKYYEVSKGLSLGQIRHQVHAVEPAFRNAIAVQFDMCALRHSEAGGESNSLPSGLYAEEACQLMRYIGEGQNLRFLHIKTEQGLETDDAKPMLVAQMIWYLLEGRTHMNLATPEIDKKLFDSYLVAVEGSEISLEFCRHQSTNKWWARLDQRELYVPCSYEDYKGAINGELSNNLTLLL